MSKEPTRTIYDCLAASFWLSQSCNKCQVSFTAQDLITHNYQLTFLKVLKINQLNLAVQIQLAHQACPCLACQENNLSYQSELKEWKKENSIN